mmetsp:Transcript_1572/g.3988  ORF Transcript_1572/g.3988 Transcript_1572/m.3988 type:complete len:117 (+) Transcript_1572:175-525(+)
MQQPSNRGHHLGWLPAHTLRVAKGPPPSADASQLVLPHALRVWIRTRARKGHLLHTDTSRPPLVLYYKNVARHTFQNPCELFKFTKINDGLRPAAVPEEAASRYVVSPEILIETDS